MDIPDDGTGLDPMHLPDTDKEIWHLTSVATGRYAGHSHNNPITLLTPFLPKGGTIQVNMDGAVIYGADKQKLSTVFALSETFLRTRHDAASFFLWLLSGKIETHGGDDMELLTPDQLIEKLTHDNTYVFDPRRN